MGPRFRIRVAPSVGVLSLGAQGHLHAKMCHLLHWPRYTTPLVFYQHSTCMTMCFGLARLSCLSSPRSHARFLDLRLAQFVGPRSNHPDRGVRYCQIPKFYPFLRSSMLHARSTPPNHCHTSRAKRHFMALAQDPNRIFLARRINKLGFRAQEAQQGSLHFRGSACPVAP